MSSLPDNLRRRVRERANGRCEYCLLPEEFAFSSHHIDHVRPLRHDGSDEFENLALACFLCNNRKGYDISGYDPETDTITFLYNPRKMVWGEHFDYDGVVIIGKTPIGRTTVHLLHFNNRLQLTTRRRLMEAGVW